MDRVTSSRATKPSCTSHHVIMFLMTLASLVPGCFSQQHHLEMAPVQGTVLLDGKPLQDGIINLESARTGYAAYAPLDENGAFRIAKIPVGTYSVTIAPPEPPAPGEPASPRPPSYGPLRAVPPKYRSATTSELTADVTSEGMGQLKFELTN